MFQQPVLALYSAAIACERAVSSDHTMARHHNSNRIRTVRQTDSSNSRWPSNFHGEMRVRNRRSAPNLPQRTPNLALKSGSGDFHRQRIYRRQLAVEVPLERLREAMPIASRLERESVFAVLSAQKPPHS